jgi:hypothetical protein
MVSTTVPHETGGSSISIPSPRDCLVSLEPGGTDEWSGGVVNHFHASTVRPLISPPPGSSGVAPKTNRLYDQ